jgi:hypothetical protein
VTERASLKPKRSASSGQHPTVKVYKKTVEKIDKSATDATHKLDQQLQEFLADLKTPVPPKPDQGQ